jgi:hypothetical protein
MYSIWTRHLKDPEDKVHFEKNVRNSSWLLEHLKILINSLDKDVERIESNTKVYDLPNWDYRQADMNGYRRALGQVQKLLDLDQKENNVSIRPE